LPFFQRGCEKFWVGWLRTIDVRQLNQLLDFRSMSAWSSSAALRLDDAAGIFQIPES
jgi:hypothetical protein